MMKKSFTLSLVAISLLACHAWSQGPPPPRLHKITEKGELKLVPSDSAPPAANKVNIEINGDERVITANGIPDHKTGRFPNPGNPNPIAAQAHIFQGARETRGRRTDHAHAGKLRGRYQRRPL